MNKEDVVLLFVNTCWKHDILPTELDFANIVSIYKKGNATDPGNYRPIALLNSLYKVIASLIKNRLSSNLEDLIWKTQYGFRAKHSTAQALFLAKRLQDYANEGQERLILALLDWEKAFDNVDQECLIVALRRLGIPDKVCNYIAIIYDDPRFRVKTTNHVSDYRKQNSGIRQGCPLSPYLFILVMTVMFHDIRENIGSQIEQGKHHFFDHNGLLYADDTLLVCTNTRTTNIYLKEIIVDSANSYQFFSRFSCSPKHWGNGLNMIPYHCNHA